MRSFENTDKIITLNDIRIAGHVYAIRVEVATRKILATECKGRWPMSDCPTGDNWLDKQLQSEVSAYFED